MRRILFAIVFHLVFGFANVQNSNPSVRIILKSQNQLENLTQVQKKIESQLQNRGFIVLESQNLSEEKKSDFNFILSVIEIKDSQIYHLEIYENCWNELIASAKKEIESEKLDINELPYDLTDEVFGLFMNYFDNLLSNGQDIKLVFKSSLNLNLEIKTNDENKKLLELLTEILNLKTQGKAIIIEQKEFEVIYKVNLPMFDNKNHSITAESFGNEMKKYLKSSVKLKTELKSISKFEIMLEL